MLTENTQRLLRIEAKLDAVIKHLQLDFNPDDAIRELARRGDRIGSIKRHRSAQGSGLADAKRQVEAMG